MKAERNRRPFTPAMAPGRACRSDEKTAGRNAPTNGAIVTATATTSADAPTTSITRQSIESIAAPPGTRRPNCCSIVGASERSATDASRAPVVTAAAQRISASATSSRDTWARPAPSARRTAISFCRLIPRSNANRATLAVTISSRTPTAPPTASSIGRTLLEYWALASRSRARQPGATLWPPFMTSAVILLSTWAGDTPVRSRT
jgi:hypothetical protein